MITLYKNGQIKTLPRRSYEVLKGNLDGWTVRPPAEKKKPEVHIEKDPLAEIVVEKTVEQPERKEPTRDEMIEFLKSKGQKVHWNIGDEKLKERYEIEIEIS